MGGLLGSTYYVSQAIESGEINNIALNLNFDMLGSPNFFRGVYDGAGAAADIRQGSVNIESLFTTFFGFEGLAWNYAAFDGRSDYGPFIENNIPAGDVLYGKVGAGGITAAKSGKALVVGVYDSNVQPGHCNNVVEGLASYLSEQGY